MNELQHILEPLKILLVCAVACVPALHAQDLLVQQPQTAPPPFKLISRQERVQIEASKDMKGRVRTTIELAELHLAQAEAHSTQGRHSDASAELGKYWALIENALDFLSPLARDSNKTRDLYKRVELALRAHGPRLTLMRRLTPQEYAVWIKEIEDFARQGRTDALNSFYGHTVVREPKKSASEKPTAQQPKEGPTPPSKPE